MGCGAGLLGFWLWAAAHGQQGGGDDDGRHHRGGDEPDGDGLVESRRVGRFGFVAGCGVVGGVVVCVKDIRRDDIEVGGFGVVEVGVVGVIEIRLGIRTALGVVAAGIGGGVIAPERVVEPDGGRLGRVAQRDGGLFVGVVVLLGDGCGVVVGVDDVELGRCVAVVGFGGPIVVVGGARSRRCVFVEVVEPLLGGHPTRGSGGRGGAAAHRDLTCACGTRW